MPEAKDKKSANNEKTPPKRQTAEDGRRSKAALVKKVLENIGQKLESNELKPTVGDFIRLLQLEKELDEESPKEIKVSWVEPGKKGRASDK
jgi:hypothetical protein